MKDEKCIFTCIGKGHGASCLPATREDWEGLRRETWLAEMCARIEKGDEQLKHRLPVWTPHCAGFTNNHRAIADAEKPLNRLMLDFDEKGHTDDIMSKLGIGSGEGIVGGMTVLLIEESVRRGTHVLVELPEGMDADTAQQLMKEATGFTPDAAVKDVARCIYMVPADHTRYVSDKLWTSSPLPINGESDYSLAKTQVSELSTPLHDSEGTGEGLSFKGIPYSQIIKEWWYSNGGEPAEGERNVKLHKLAVNLRAICDNKREVLMQVMPRFGLTDAELKSIIDSACKEEPKGISKPLSSIIENLNLKNGNEEEENEATGNESLSIANYPLSIKKLPIGLRESLIGVPESMYMPVLCAVMPIAATYADQVEVQYCDGERMKLGLMSIIHGEQASGKSVCKRAVNIWKRQFDKEDELARQREEAWTEHKKSRKANEKLPENPKVLVRVVPVTISCSTLLKRLKYANGHTLYSFCEELDTLRKTNSAGNWSAKYDIYRLAFDSLDSEWGQDYNSDQAESGVVKVAYNWTMLGTNGAVRKCFKGDNIENGLSSRILLAEMPDSSFAKIPKYGRRSAEDEERIQEAVTRLRSYSGFVDTPRLREAIEQWCEEKRVEALKNIDHVMDTYRRRAAVIGFRCGIIHFLLSQENGKGEEDASVEFAVMMAEYCLQQQMKTFGEALANAYVDARSECQRFGVNDSIFDQLANTFTMADLRALKHGQCGESALRTIISRWRQDGWIEKTDTKHWRKMSHCHIVTTSH